MGSKREITKFFCCDPLGLFKEKSTKGVRTDIRRTLASVSSYEELVLEHPDCAAKCRNVALDYFRLRRRGNHRGTAPKVLWIYGATGTGKSRLAVEFSKKIAGDDYFIHAPGNLKWWDGYEGQQVVIVDDFRRSHLREIGGFSYLLRILDRYDCEVEVKGSTRCAEWECVIITCPRDPITEFTYRGSNNEDVIEEDVGQLIRRLAHIIELRVLQGMVLEIDHTTSLKQRYTAGDRLELLRHS